jgi:hypothetical protein
MLLTAPILSAFEFVQ